MHDVYEMSDAPSVRQDEDEDELSSNARPTLLPGVLVICCKCTNSCRINGMISS